MEVKVQNKYYFYPITVIAGAILICLTLALLFVKPLYKSVSSMNKDIKEKKVVLNALEDKLEKLKKLQSKEQELTEQKNKVLAALPEDKDVARLFVQLEDMVSDTGALVESATESNPLSASQNGTAVNSNISGVNNHNYILKFKTPTYESIKNSVQNAENALRLLNINSLSIDLREKEFVVEFGVKTYSREDQ